MTETAGHVAPHQQAPPVVGREVAAASGWRPVWREHRVLVLLAAAFVGGSYLVGPFVGLPEIGESLRSLQIYRVVTEVVLMSPPFVLLARRFRLDRDGGARLAAADAWREAVRRAARAEFALERVAGLLVVWATFPLCLATFLSWKSAIRHVHPFAWDARLAKLDALLHGGVEPWVLLHPLLGTPVVTRVVDLLYGPVWLTLVPAVPFVVAWMPYSHRRRRFLVAYLLMWIVLGVGAATAFSSAGPCYYAWAAPGAAENPYAPLMQYLARVDASRPLVALRAQNMLAGHPGFGISAMPSLHVASVMLLVLAAAGLRRRRWLLAAAVAYAAAVLAGSVHLGWHYAADGYAAALGVAGLWWLAGRLTREPSGAAFPDAARRNC